MKIAIMYICTGKYEMFWDVFYKTCSQYFYSNSERSFFVFTDSERIIKQKHDDVRVYYQAKSGWPYDTLLRYQWFCTVQDLLSPFDYCYYINANAQFLKPVTEAIMPFPTLEQPLIISLHPNFYDDLLGETFHPERNPNSEAYVPVGTPCRSHCGAFWGATKEAFITMCCELRDRTSRDLSNGIIAIWHDQSHLIKYATEVPHINVEKGLVSYEEYADMKKCVLIFPAKAKFGGNDSLREVSTRERLSHMPKFIYSKLLNAAHFIHLDGMLRKFVKMFK